jgi:hypothetical protein
MYNGGTNLGSGGRYLQLQEGITGISCWGGE